MRILTRPENSLANFRPPNLKQKAANYALRRNSLANANVFANEIAKISSSLRNFLANGSLRQNSLAIANAMAWCTQPTRAPMKATRIAPTKARTKRFHEGVHPAQVGAHESGRGSPLLRSQGLPTEGQNGVDLSFSPCFAC